PVRSSSDGSRRTQLRCASGFPPNSGTATTGCSAGPSGRQPRGPSRGRPAELVYVSHVLLGGPVGAATGAPFAVKAHGSELEYAMRGRPDLGAWGAEALAGARATFVGSAHIRQVLTDVCGPVPRVHEVPPGVDVDLWRPE